MKTSHLYPNQTNAARLPARGGRHALVLAALIGGAWNPAICLAQAPADTVPAGNAEGVQVLTRGPVHEAFAGMITFNAEPGIVVAKAPPAMIEEVPPGERPEGNNVTWIPGYWAWDEERSDFLWISGTWRALPPGRQWMAGYWGETTQGYQWTSGYWADAAAQETTYLPQPPATVEAGPNVAAPSADYRWMPGNWSWNQDRYAWGPGYWARGRADWDWSPAHYVWTPRGYVFVDGYWDYPVSRRGSLFAPVYFDSGVYSRSGYSYSPSLLIDLAVFTEALFLRPNYHHYYFGDYYDNRYQQGGYFSAYAYQGSRHGYDPIYSHQRWQHRQDRNWDRRMGDAYQYRRDNVNARPPRTWDAQRAISGTSEFKQNRMLVATPIDQMAKRKDADVRFQAVTKEERQKLAQRGQEVGQFRDQRRTLETKGTDAAPRKAGDLTAPIKVERAKSPIVAKSANQLGKGKMPPAALRTPKLEATAQPKADPSERQARPDTGKSLPEPRNTADTPRDKQTLPEPRKNADTPRDKQTLPEPRKTTATPRDKQAQPEPRRAAVTPRDKQTLPEPRKTATPRERQAQPEPRKVAAPRERQAQPEPRKVAAPRERQAQPEPRKVAAPRERQAQPEPRKPAAVPREQPAARESAPRDSGKDPDEKDHKKKGRE